MSDNNPKDESKTSEKQGENNEMNETDLDSVSGGVRQPGIGNAHGGTQHRRTDISPKPTTDSDLRGGIHESTNPAANHSPRNASDDMKK